ncbi:hypothetical protein QUA54_20855 [Microcoleus sp. MOSTC5]
MRASPLAIVLASRDARTDIIQIYYSDATGNDMTGAIAPGFTSVRSTT